MKRRDLAPPIPDNPLPYLTDWLFEIGPTVATGMGYGAIGWRDMEAWQALSGIDLMPWEAQLLRRLSRDFVDQVGKSDKPDCPAPWSPPELDEQTRSAVADKVAAAFEALMRTGNRS